MKSLIQRLSLGQQGLLLAGFGVAGIGLMALQLLRMTGWNHAGEILAMALLISIALFALAYYMGRHTAARADRIVTALRSLAKGDLNQKLQIPGKDEFSWMAWEFNRACQKVDDTIGEILRHADELAAAATELDDVMGETRRQVQDQDGQTAQLAESMTEMTASIQQVSQDIATTAEEADEADRLAKTGFQQFEATLESISQVTRKTEEIASVIDRLQADSSAIGGVMEVIRGIAEQTNLLALNAAIEAARAGEQGRGFAVVAEEVRTLASRTQESTREIQEMIERLQQAAGEAVQAIEAGKTEVAVSIERARQAGESLTQILDSVDQISQRCSRIATAAVAQSSTAEGVNRNVGAIHGLTRNAAASAAQTADFAGQLTRLATRLQASVNRFKVNEG